jgi:hypothetical protein
MSTRRAGEPARRREMLELEDIRRATAGASGVGEAREVVDALGGGEGEGEREAEGESEAV